LIADLLVLGELARGPRHGYDLNKELQRVFGPDFVLNPNILYPALRRLREAEFVTREVQRKVGPDRHVYRLTASGRTHLLEQLRTFTPDLAKHDSEFKARVAFFDLLSESEREAIIGTRRTALIGRINQCQDRQRGDSRFAAELSILTIRLSKDELEWLNSLTSKTADADRLA
jgi:DNA-binding PadR family transcriptional regulator